MMAGVISFLSAVIGYLEGRVGNLFEKILAKLLVVGILDAVLTWILITFKGFGVFGILLTLLLVIIVILAVAGNKEEMLPVITTMTFLIILLLAMNFLLGVSVEFILVKPIELAKLLAIPIIDVIYGILGYVLAISLKTTGYE